jgi:phage head maturation protease
MREIRAARLHHVSLVDEPAYTEAQIVATRAAESFLADMRAYFRGCAAG